MAPPLAFPSEYVTLSKRLLSFPLSSPSPSDTLTLTSTHPLPLAFKVLTNNSSRYIVRPNLGLLVPSAAVTMRILVNPCAAGSLPTPTAGPSRDKFRVSIAPAPYGLTPNFWHGALLDRKNYKLRVQFLKSHINTVHVFKSHPLQTNSPQSTIPASLHLHPADPSFTDYLTLSKRLLSFSLSSPAAETLTLTSTHPTALAFKVKTNNASRYAVRPNESLLSPSAVVAIQIRADPRLYENHITCNSGISEDKFLVCVAPAPEGLTPDFWLRNRSDHRKYKLQVQFLDRDAASFENTFTSTRTYTEDISKLTYKENTDNTNSIPLPPRGNSDYSQKKPNRPVSSMTRESCPNMAQIDLFDATRIPKPTALPARSSVPLLAISNTTSTKEKDKCSLPNKSLCHGHKATNFSAAPCKLQSSISSALSLTASSYPPVLSSTGQAEICQELPACGLDFDSDQEAGYAGLNGLLPNRTAWCRPIYSWINAALQQVCNMHCRPYSIVRQAFLGGIRIRLKTRNGDFMVEAFAGSGRAGSKTAKLGSIVPRYVGQVLAMSQKQDAILMSDYMAYFKNSFSATEKETLTLDYVWMQMETMGRLDELIEAGFMDLRPQALLRILTDLEVDEVYRDLAGREGHEAHARSFVGYMDQMEKWLRHLMDCGIPSTIVGPQDCRQQKGNEHYMFFGWLEGYVGCAISSRSDWFLDETCFMNAWSSFEQIERIAHLRDIGRCVHGLCLLILRLEYARMSGEDAEAREFWINRAGMALELAISKSGGTSLT